VCEQNVSLAPMYHSWHTVDNKSWQKQILEQILPILVTANYT